MINTQENYWRALYWDSKEIPRLNLPNDYKRPEVFTFTGDNYTFRLEKEDSKKFKELGSRNGGTLYINILTALNTLFYKYTGQSDIIIGSGIAGRRHLDLLGIIGMFVNTLGMRNHPQGEKTYQQFLKQVIDNSINAFENQDVQFEELVEKLDLERDASRNPLFDVMMVVQNFNPVKQNVLTLNKNQTKNKEIQNTQSWQEDEEGAYTNQSSKFDMTFFIYESGSDVYINIEYYTAIFKKETIIQLARRFQKLVKAVIANPVIKLKDIDVLEDQEKQQILTQFNDTATIYPKENAIGQLFEKQVEMTPHHTALVFRETHLTYQALDEQANQLANYLYDKKRVVQDEPVAILLEKGITAI